jgi:hypothetical protein
VPPRGAQRAVQQQGQPLRPAQLTPRSLLSAMVRRTALPSASTSAI